MDEISVSPKNHIGWYEETIPIRGYLISLEDIAKTYRELQAINRKFGETLLASIPKPDDMSDNEWEDKRKWLLDDGFRLTVSIKGIRDQQLYGEDESIFRSDELPTPIKTIYFNNITAWRRHSQNSEPPNRLEVELDFEKPALLDPNPLVSEATPNESEVRIKADEITFFRATGQIIKEKLLVRKTRYGFLHRDFSYDFGMWAFILPAALLISSYYMNKLLPIGSNLEGYRWAFFIYTLGIIVLLYRFSTSYAKWAFPVNVLKENKDRSWKHRIAIASMFAWVFYKTIDIIWKAIIT